MYLIRFCLVHVVMPGVLLSAFAAASGLEVHPPAGFAAGSQSTPASSTPDTNPASRAPSTTTLSLPGAGSPVPSVPPGIGVTLTAQVTAATTNTAVPSYVVTTVTDTTSGTASNCTNQGVPGAQRDADCSLRDALAASTTVGGAISFDATAFGPAQPAAARTITLGSAGTLVVPSNTAVTGLTSGTGYSLTNLVTVSGGTLYTVFTVNAGTKAAALSSLNIINYTDVTVSQYALTSAGGVANNGGTLTISGSNISFNPSEQGAVYNAAGGTLTITGSTLSNDGAQTWPSGAIQNQGTLTLTNSTLGNNYTQSNSLGLGAAGIANSGALTIASSTFAGNYYSFPDLFNTGTMKITNTVVGICSGSGCPSNYQNGNVPFSGGLAPLGNYGGPTQTAPGLPGSDEACGGIASTLATDQRGMPRSATYPAGKCYDSGAVQTLYSFYFATQPPANIGAGANFNVGLQVAESGMPFPVSGIVIGVFLATGDPGSLNTTSLTTDGSGSTSSNTLTISTPGTGDELLVQLAVAPDYAPYVYLRATSNAFNVTSTNVQVSFATQRSAGYGPVPAFSYTVDGATYTAPATLTWAVGSQHTFSTITPQQAGCIHYIFGGWQYGGKVYAPITETVTATTTVTSYQANFDTDGSVASCLLTTSASPAAGGTVTPGSGNYGYDANVPLTARPNPGYAFVNWTGPVNSPTSPATTIVMNGPETVVGNFLAIPTITHFVVNNNGDGLAAPAGCLTPSGVCRLRDALTALTIVGGGTITFSPTVFAPSQPMSARTISLEAVLIIPSNTSITGPTTGSGATLTQLVTLTPLNDTAFEIDKGTVHVSISGLAISGGSFYDGVNLAEVVRSDGVLTISNSSMTGNSSGVNAYGAPAVFNDADGTLTLTDCNISSNLDWFGPGGGIENLGTLVVTGSTISGNSTVDSDGAGLENGGTATLTNTTVSGNSILFHNDGGRGGGIANSGTLNLVNSSVTGNGASNPGDGSGINTTGTLHVTNSTIVSNLSNYNETYDYEHFPAVEDDCDGPGCPPEQPPAPPVFTPPGGTYADVGYAGVNVNITDTTPGTVIFYTTDGSTPTTSSDVWFGRQNINGSTVIKAAAYSNGFSAVATATYTVATGACTLIDYSSGFTPAALTLNGGATVNGSLLQLTDGGLNEARSAFYSTPVPTTEFTTDFQFQLLYPLADGITFTIQSAGPHAVGQGGGGLGYAGIPKSVALKFDLFNNSGEGFNSSGYYFNGAYPSTPALDLFPYGLYLHSGHVFAVHITYVGQVTTATITDLATYQSHSASIPGDLTKLVGNTAYVGFTGGTGILTATQNILTWTYGAGSGCGITAAP